MAKQKGDIEIGYRMVDELMRLFGTQANAARKAHFDRHSVSWWASGGTPGGHSLAKLHYCGGDVMYVLTGERGVKRG